MGNSQSYKAKISRNPDEKPFSTDLIRIDKSLAKDPLVVYTKRGDKCSEPTKKILKDEGLRYQEKDFDKLDSRTIDTMKKTVDSARDTPWVFICGNFIGNYKDIEKAHKEKTLMNIVEECRDEYNEFYRIE